MTPATSPSPLWRIVNPVAAGMALLIIALAPWAIAGREQSVPDAPVAKVRCLSYTPFRAGESPFQADFVARPERIEEDLRALSSLTSCVRTYAVDQGIDAVPPIAERLGMQVLMGMWIGRDRAANEKQISAGIALAARHPATVRAVIVGNEVLLRGEQRAEDLALLIRRVRAAVPAAVAVTYADVWEFWVKNPELQREVDLITIHALPYWEDQPIAVNRAVTHVADVVREVQRLLPEKPVLIGEVGWPSAGRSREAALPTPVAQATFLRGIVTWAEGAGVDYNLIEAFDQPWKRVLEGTVGGHWGLFDAHRVRKVAMIGPVSDVPNWHIGAVVSVVVAGLIAGWGAWRSRSLGGALRLLPLFCLAGAAGLALSWSALFLNDSTRTAFGWVVAVGLWSATLVQAFALAEAVARGRRAGGAGLADFPPMSAIIAALRARRLAPLGTQPMGAVLGWCVAVTAIAAAAFALGLVVDPRYRDVPTPLLLIPAALQTAVVLLGHRRLSDPGERAVAVVIAVSLPLLVLRATPQNFEILGFTAVLACLAAGLWRRPQSRVPG